MDRSQSGTGFSTGLGDSGTAYSEYIKSFKCNEFYSYFLLFPRVLFSLSSPFCLARCSPLALSPSLSSHLLLPLVPASLSLSLRVHCRPMAEGFRLLLALDGGSRHRVPSTAVPRCNGSRAVGKRNQFCLYIHQETTYCTTKKFRRKKTSTNQIVAGHIH